MVCLIRILLSISTFIRFVQLMHPPKLEIENEQALKYKQDLLSAKLSDISSDLQLEYAYFDGFVQIDDLNIPNDALLMAIHKYGELLDVKAEVEFLFEKYKSKRSFRRYKDVSQFKLDRRINGFKIFSIINHSDEFDRLYEKFIKIAIKYGRILKGIEDPDSEKNPKKWKDLNIEVRAELVRLVYDRLMTCTELLQYCNELQAIFSNVLLPMIDIFKELTDVSKMENFVQNFNVLFENQWEKVTQLYVIHNIDLLSEKIGYLASPIYVTIQKHNSEKESFKDDIRKWKELAYQGELIEDSDSSTEFILNKKKETTINIILKRMAEDVDADEGEIKKVKFDKEKIEGGRVEEFRKVMEDAKLHEISYDLQMDYLLADETNSDNLDVIKNLDIANGNIADAIFKYDAMLAVQIEVKILLTDYQRTYKRNISLNRPPNYKRTIATGMASFFVRLDQLAQLYERFIEFAMNDVKKFSEVVDDPDIAWESLCVENRIELIRKLNERLFSCVDLLNECNTLQATSLNTLTVMKTIFNELKDVSTLASFLSKMTELLKNQRKQLLNENFNFKIDVMSNKLKRIPEKGLDIYNKRQYFDEMKDTNPLYNVINRWKQNVLKLEENDYFMPSSGPGSGVPSNRVVIQYPGIGQEIAIRLRAYEFHIDNEYLYDMFAFVDGYAVETISTTDLNTPRRDLLEAINECISMLKDLELASLAFFKLAKETPENLINLESIKRSLKSKMGLLRSRVYKFAEIYEEVIQFATNVIKELSGIVFEEENIPWEDVNLEDKRKLLEMANIRLMACTRLLGFSNELKPKIHPILIEAGSLITQSNNQAELLLKNFNALGYTLSDKNRQAQIVLEKLSQNIVIDSTKTEDKYGRYEFEKWLHSWRRDIIDWKLRAYRGVAKKDIVIYYERESPAL